ncbi:MAG: fasciclin domain-containing protein [Mangrovibacterium sp.]
MVLLIGINCKREYGEFYDPPKGQEGEIYLQLAANPDLSTFVSAIDMVPGLKEELSASGLFTVMAPDNQAFDKYFASQPTYKSLDAIPPDELAAIVKFHIMKWMLFQIDFLNPGLTGKDYGLFKYETRATTKYTDRSVSGRDIPLFYTSKLLQVYTPNYYSNFNVSANDYTDVYGDGSGISTTTKLNVMGASVKEADVAAGNGCYYIIDQVLTPPANIAQELDTNPEYSYYNQLIKKSFVSYSYNKAGTIAQGNNGDITGDGIVDSLWIRSYDIDPNLDNENPIASNKKDRISLTAFVPNRSAFQQYLDNKLLPNFSNKIDSVPEHTLLLLFKSHITNMMDWPSRVDRGLTTNILGDRLAVSRSDIESVKMASNGLFYQLNKVVEPKLFNAAPGPAYMSTKYWYFAEMLLNTGLTGLLTSDALSYTVLAPSDSAFKAKGIVYVPNPATGRPGFYDVSGTTPSYISGTTLLKIIGNHIILNHSLSTTDINARDGYYPTQNNSYIAVENGKIRGSELDSIPAIILPDKSMSNGYFHGIDKVITYPKQSIYQLINSATAVNVTVPVNTQYLKFKELCSAAGILSADFTSTATGSITAVNADKRFTLFVPSNEAIIAAQEANKLPKTGAQGSTSLSAADKIRLANYIKSFFIPEREIFTDGKILGSFPTVKVDANASTPSEIIYVPVEISLPALTVKTKDGSVGKVILSDQKAYPQNRICMDGVVHIIDNAFTSQY